MLLVIRLCTTVYIYRYVSVCVCVLLFVLILEHRCTIKEFDLSKPSMQNSPTQLFPVSQFPSQCNWIQIP